MICGAAVALLTIAACKGKDAPAAASVSAAAATTSATSTSSGASDAQVASDAQALASYPLTSENIAKVSQVMHTIKSLEKSDPALKAQWENHDQSDNPKSIDEMIARMNNAPRGPEILRSAGISAHDFVYTNFALMYATVAYQMKKAGQPMTTGKLATQINPANIDFVAAHQAEIKAMNGADDPGSDQ